VLQHEIFSGPFPVTLDKQVIDTPKNYRKYYNGKSLPDRLEGWKVHDPNVGPTGRPIFGSVAVRAGFDDAIDSEVISSGKNTKGPDWVSIGRHGNFLMWGFSASPKLMTESGKDVFANAIVYMRKFDHQTVRYKRRFVGRDWWVQQALEFKDSPKQYDSILKRSNESVREMLLKRLGTKKEFVEKTANRLFPRLWQKYGDKDLEIYYHEILKHRAYLYSNGRSTYSPARIDFDIVEYGIPNNDPKLLDHCISMLEKKESVQRAKRILKRYTGHDFDTHQQWRRWFNEVKKQLHFTDSGGYRFYSEVRSTSELRLQSSSESEVELSDLNPVSISAQLIPDSNSAVTATLVVRIQVAQDWHLYDSIPLDVPNTMTEITEWLPKSIKAIGKWKKPPSFPSVDDQRVKIWQGDLLFHRRVRASKPSDFSKGIDVKVQYQTCDKNRCQPPNSVVINAKLK